MSGALSGVFREGGQIARIAAGGLRLERRQGEWWVTRFAGGPLSIAPAIKYGGQRHELVQELRTALIERLQGVLDPAAAVAEATAALDEVLGCEVDCSPLPFLPYRAEGGINLV